MRRRLIAVAAGALLAACAGVAAAQTPPRPGQAPARPPRPPRYELAVQGSWTGPISFGAATESLTKPDGTPLVVFSTDNRLGAGFGVEADLGIILTKRLMAEVTGSWTQGQLESRITGDIEGADPLTATASLMRFTVEGAALWTFKTRGKASYFLRGSAGWQREVAETNALTDDSVVATAGAGMKYWWRDRPRGTLRRVGLRVEGRAMIRTGGLTLGESATRVAPVVTGGLVLGF